mmetsp:Transcript_19729/g.35582  ORF Transcript_19729/g.35582 Transcript_19729/m.35582 type:complete len:280 (+) Transcript_19729:454-1293(+)
MSAFRICALPCSWTSKFWTWSSNVAFFFRKNPILRARLRNPRLAKVLSRMSYASKSSSSSSSLSLISPSPSSPSSPPLSLSLSLSSLSLSSSSSPSSPSTAPPLPLPPPFPPLRRRFLVCHISTPSPINPPDIFRCFSLRFWGAPLIENLPCALRRNRWRVDSASIFITSFNSSSVKDPYFRWIRSNSSSVSSSSVSGQARGVDPERARELAMGFLMGETKSLKRYVQKMTCRSSRGVGAPLRSWLNRMKWCIKIAAARKGTIAAKVKAVAPIMMRAPV